MHAVTVIDTITIGDRTWRFQDYSGLERFEREELSKAILAAERDFCSKYLKTHKRLPFGNSNTWKILEDWEDRVSTPLERLERMLKNHDWYYAMSDDFRWYSAGETQRRRILALVEQLGDEGRRLYESYSLKHMGHT